MSLDMDKVRKTAQRYISLKICSHGLIDKEMLNVACF